jgi:hypothetical protein
MSNEILQSNKSMVETNNNIDNANKLHNKTVWLVTIIILVVAIVLEIIYIVK